jgi:hypothetical protein
MIVSEITRDWADKEVYVGCSGNFTIERILAKNGVKKIHSNDISLYSCALGWFLTGKNINMSITKPGWDWLYDYMDNEIGKIACLMLVFEMLKYSGRSEPYHRRMFTAYKNGFSKLHKKTVEKISKALDGVEIQSFYAGDVVDFMNSAPGEAAVIGFPPTYVGGYEKLYKKLDALFDWEKPEYMMFDDERLEKLRDIMTSKGAWCISSDKKLPDMKANSMVRTSLRNKPVYIYSGGSNSRLITPRQKIECVPWERLEDVIGDGALSIAKITSAQMNLLRSEYLTTEIVPAGITYSYAVLFGGKLVGAAGFTSQVGYATGGAYMATDFAIRPTVHKRLSKLVLAAVLSVEMKAILEQAICRRIYTIDTTAFTQKAVSMKYRGLFDIHSRKPGRINYFAKTGRWTLGEAFEWWKKNHSQTWES